MVSRSSNTIYCDGRLAGAISNSQSRPSPVAGEGRLAGEIKIVATILTTFVTCSRVEALALSSFGCSYSPLYRARRFTAEEEAKSVSLDLSADAGERVSRAMTR